MGLKSKFVSSIGLLGLLCLMLPGSLRADDFTFSFTNTFGITPGTVTGEILGLTDNTTSAPAKVFIDSYPAIFAVNPDLSTPPVDVLSTWTTFSLPNVFTETAGVITSSDFFAEDPISTNFLLLDSSGSPGYELNVVLPRNRSAVATNSIVYTPIPAPEPSSIALMLAGIGFLLVMRKRIGQGLPQAS